MPIREWIPDLLATHYWVWLLQGWLVTLAMSVVVVVSSTALGLLLAAARVSPRRHWQRAGAIYLSVFRNTPLLVQLFFWYFGVSSLLPEDLREWLFAAHGVQWQIAGLTLTLRWPSFEVLTATLGLVLYATAYVGEEVRAGILGVPRQQVLAAQALGMTPRQVLTVVVLPQALRLALAPLFGQYMNIVKNTSLAMAVGLVELSYASRQVEAESFRTFQAFGAATALYVVTILALEGLLVYVQRLLQQPGTRLATRAGPVAANTAAPARGWRRWYVGLAGR